MVELFSLGSKSGEDEVKKEDTFLANWKHNRKVLSATVQCIITAESDN